MLTRRHLVAGMLTITVAPLLAEVQPGGKIPHIRILWGYSPAIASELAPAAHVVE